MYYIVEAVARVYGFVVPDLLGRSTGRAIVEARQVAAYLGRRAGASYTRIGQALRRHHSTVLHGVRKTSDSLVTSDESFRQKIEQAWDLATTMRDQRLTSIYQWTYQ